MNSIQRAWCYVIRKPMKSILLLLIIAVISLFIVCGAACKNASVKTQDATRKAVGASLRLDANEKNRSKRLSKYSSKIGDNMEGSYGGVHQKKIETAYGTQWQVWTDNSFETLLIADIEKIASVEGIGDYNISTCITPVYPVNFKRIEDKDADQYNDLGGVSLIGNRKAELDFNMLSGNVTLKEGRMITESDRNVCMISEQLAEKNALSIGDVLQFMDYHDKDNVQDLQDSQDSKTSKDSKALQSLKTSQIYSQTYGAKIVGIYKTKQPIPAIMSGDTFRSENIIFTDLHFPEKAEGNANNPCFEHAYFQVENVEEYEKVKANIEAIDIDWERYDLIDRNGNINTMSSNFNDLEKISKLFMGVTFVSGFAILFLIFIFWIKNRSHEIGILLSLGNTKISILGQLFAEALFIAILALFLTFMLAPQVSHITANYLVAAQVEEEKLQQEMDEDKISGGQQSKQTVVGVNVEITEDMVFSCVLSVFGLLGISIFLAEIPVLRKNPRDIFSELS